LAVSQSEDRAALVYCHTGCTAEDVVEALGLSVSDLTASRPVACYVYEDEAGQSLLRVVRWEPKTFRQQHWDPGNGKPGRWVNGAKGVPRVPYRLPELIAALKAGEPVYIVEGEKDADLLATDCDVAATCNAGGAGKWTDEHARWFEGMSSLVYVVADRDAPGYRHAVAVVDSLAGVGVEARIVEARVGKDATDHLQEHDLSDFVGVPLDEAKVRSVVPADVRQLSITRASDITSERVRYAWEGRIPLRGMTLLAGEEGIGKSLVEVDLIAQLTRGDLEGELYGQPQSVFLLLPEDDVKAVVKPRLEAASAVTERVHIVNAAVLDGEGRSAGVLNLPADLDLLAAEMQRANARIVFCDSFADLLHDDLDAHQYKPVVKAIHQINDWARAHDFAVVGLWHINKTQSSDSAAKLMGSRGFRTAMRSVLMAFRDPDASEGVNAGVIVLDKVNAGRPAEALRYVIGSWDYVVEEVDPVTGAVELVDGNCGVIRWDGGLGTDGRELLKRALGGVHRSNSVDRACEWLLEFLSDGPMSRQEILSAAKGQGLSEAAIKRASAQLGVDSNNCPVPRQGKPPIQRAVWSLPAANAGSPLVRTDPPPPKGAKGPKGPTEKDDPKERMRRSGPIGSFGSFGSVRDSRPKGEPKAERPRREGPAPGRGRPSSNNNNAGR